MPTLSGFACATEIQKASSVCALSVRPESKMVTEIWTGMRRPICSKASSMAKSAALALSVSKMVSTSSVSHAALDQAERLLAIGIDELHVGDAARAGIVGVAGDRGGAVGRAHRSGDKTLAARIRGDEFVAHAAGEPGGLDVEFRDDRFEVVIGLGNGLGVEGVGLDDVGAGFEEAAMDVGNDIGPRKDEKIAVALEVLVMILKSFAAEVGFRRA